MTDLGQLLIDAVQDQKIPDADHAGAYALARFYNQRGELTTPMQVVAHDLLTRAGIDAGERPTDHDGDVEEVQVSQRQGDVELKRKADVTFRVRDDRIVAQTPFDLKDICKSVPGRRWDPNERAWVWPKGPVAAMALRDAFAEYEPVWDKGFDALLGELGLALDLKEADDLPDIPNVSTVAWIHQRRAYGFVCSFPGAALHMDMGTGKSLVAVGRALDIGGDILIACPDKVLGVWPREFRRHGAHDVHWENGLRKKRTGGHKKLKVADRVEEFNKLRNCTCGRPHVYITNYETLVFEPMKTWVKNRDWDLFIMDEAHRLKSPMGAQSKVADKIGARSAYRLALTGTPMPHSAMDIFAQYRAMEPGVFGRNWTNFRNRYAVMGGYEDKEIVGVNPLTIDELRAKVYQFAYRVKADDVLDLPELLEDQFLTCTMGAKQAKAYKQMKDELAAEFPGLDITELAVKMLEGETVAANAAVKALRLRQITGGGLKDDATDKVLAFPDEAKRALLKDWMEDHPADEPLVVFAEFTHDVKTIVEVGKELGREVGEVSGRRNDLTDDSEYPPDKTLMAVQIASGGSGVDLTRACYAAYYSTGYNNGNYRQSRARLHRPGQTRPVRFTHLLCEDTVDVTVFEHLEKRQGEVDAMDPAA